jgi:prevent-host-death family protein
MYIQDMARRYSVADARASLPTIVDQAEAGQTVELTRRGEPVAVVVSLKKWAQLQARRSTFRDAYRAFLDRYSLDDIGLDAEWAGSARDRTPGRKVSL